MERVVPWNELYALIEPFYTKQGKDRPPAGLERMLRIDFLQSRFHSVRIATEEALYDIESIRRFIGIDLGNETTPDETTICTLPSSSRAPRPRGANLSQEVNAHLEEKGLILSEETIMDATIINASSSMKKRNQYYFGMKIHVGVDTESRTAHSLVTTPAKVHDSKILEDLLHGEETSSLTTRPTWGKTEEIAKKTLRALDLT